MDDNTCVAFCPHCGNRAPQHAEGHFKTYPGGDLICWYHLVRCGTCGEGLVYRRLVSTCDPDAGYFEFELGAYELVWPQPSALHVSVPKSVRKCYEEAGAIKNLAPNAFAGQIRRSLEALCKDRNATGHVLAQKLKQLADRGEIPANLAAMTEVLRELGNTGSHAGDKDVDPKFVPAIDDFFRAIVEYVYVAPWKVAEFEAQLAAAKEDPPEDDGPPQPTNGSPKSNGSLADSFYDSAPEDIPDDDCPF